MAGPAGVVMSMVQIPMIINKADASAALAWRAVL
jgi:hypothetical protein